MALPTPDEEIWRYSRIDELDLARFHLPAVSGSAGPAREGSSARVSMVDGRVVGIDVDAAAAARGLEVGRLAELDRDGSRLGSVMHDATDAFAEMNTAFGADPLLVRVPAGMTVAAPVVIRHDFTAPGGAFFPRLVIHVGADAEVTVLDEMYSDDIEALVVPVVELDAAPAARARLLSVNRLGRRVWQIASHITRGERDSTTRWAHVALGGDYARVRTDARLVGPGASGEQTALYFGEDHQMHDVRTLQDHVAPRTSSNLLFKGAVEGQARSVYSGLIRIGKDAKNAAAYQTNRNITLSEGAWAESVPNLDIQNNEVKCSHASAVGPIDADQRFYLESRGIPTSIAERLIVLGFFDEVITQLPVPALIEELRQAVADKLDRREA